MELRAEHIKVSYDTSEILKDVSVRTRNNEFVGIIGPNGSGKSTLLKCIYRVLRPKEGCVWLDKEKLYDMSVRSSAKKMAVVTQHNYYNFEFTVLEVVLMGRSPHKKALERDNARDYEIVMNALKRVGMDSFSNRNFSTLSGGEQQRVILARALAQDTSCLILDEPTNHLDITHQLQLMEIVKSLDITVLAAIHDLNIAVAYCDYLYVLKNGQVVGKGKPKELLTPEFLYEVYSVKTEIVKDKNERMHILFC